MEGLTQSWAWADCLFVCVFPDDLFYLEAGSWIVAAFYLVCYFLGKWQNKRIANQWLDDAQPHLVKQFTYTGATAKPVVGLLEESNNNFKYYCTGRRFCSRLVVDLQVHIYCPERAEQALWLTDASIARCVRSWLPVTISSRASSVPLSQSMTLWYVRYQVPGCWLTGSICSE